MLVLAVTGLALTAVLAVLVRRRRAEDAKSATEGPTDLDRTLSAHFEAPPSPSQPPSGVAGAGPAVDAPAGPAVESRVDIEAPAPGEPVTGVWARRRSPYAPGRDGRHRIALPDDDADPEIPWRTEEGSIAQTHGTTPLVRTNDVATTGRIGVGDDASAVTWRPRTDHD